MYIIVFDFVPFSSAATTTTTTTNPGTMLLPFLRVQPVAVAGPTNFSMDIVPAGGTSVVTTVAGPNGSAGGSRRHHHHHHHHHGHHHPHGNPRNKPIDAVPGAGADTVPINESIISLLLKLHSQLSGTLDSFSLEAGDCLMSDGIGSTAHPDDVSMGSYF